MNRKDTKTQFKEIVGIIRKAYKNANLTTDIIVGFPQETEEEFKKTFEFLKEIKFYKMHIFKYSPRKGTLAEKMQGQILPQIKEERSRKLIELSDKNEEEYNKEYVGNEVEVLWEEEKQGIYKGHTKNYILVEQQKESAKQKENTIENVEIVEARDHYIIAK